MNVDNNINDGVLVNFSPGAILDSNNTKSLELETEKTQVEAQKAKYEKMMKVAGVITGLVALGGFIAWGIFLGKMPNGTYDKFGSWIEPPHSIYEDLALVSGLGVMMGGGMLAGIPAAKFAKKRLEKSTQLDNLKNQITKLDTQQIWLKDDPKFLEYWNTAVQQNVGRLNPAKVHETLDYVHNAYEIENKKRELEAALRFRSPGPENVFGREEQPLNQEKIRQLSAEIAELEQQNSALFKDGLVVQDGVARG